MLNISNFKLDLQQERSDYVIVASQLAATSLEKSAYKVIVGYFPHHLWIIKRQQTEEIFFAQIYGELTQNLEKKVF